MDEKEKKEIASLAERKMQQAATDLVISEPFWGLLSAKLKRVPRDCGTAFTDGVNLGYDPAFIASLTVDEVIAVQGHEVWHNADGDLIRGKGKDPRLWNIACDLKINPGLIAAGFKLPKEAIYP